MLLGCAHVLGGGVLRADGPGGNRLGCRLAARCVCVRACVCVFCVRDRMDGCLV